MKARNRSKNKGIHKATFHDHGDLEGDFHEEIEPIPLHDFQIPKKQKLLYYTIDNEFFDGDDSPHRHHKGSKYDA